MTHFALDLRGHSKTLSHFPHCSNRHCKKTYQTSKLNSVDRYLKKPHEAPQNRPNELVTNHSVQDMINKQRMNCVVLSVHSCFKVAWRSLQGLNRNQSALFSFDFFYKTSISEQELGIAFALARILALESPISCKILVSASLAIFAIFCHIFSIFSIFPTCFADCFAMLRSCSSHRSRCSRR